MPLGPFGLISLFYAVLAVRCLWQLARSWSATWDRRFTPDDRLLVDQAAFFVLVPISVALHELGHAVAVWRLGGDVLGWGYFGFAGYVEFDPGQFDAAQRIFIASAGTLVNLLLGALALAVVFLKRPPLRAAFNELLIQFTVISLLNALVLYPLLDFASGLNGDWRQMYFGGVPSLSLLILVIHVSVLGALWWAWNDPRVRARIAALTDGGGVHAPWSRPSAPTPARATLTPAERALAEAGDRVASGWPGPVRSGVQQTPDGPLLVLSWGSAGGRRAVLARASGDRVELDGAVVVGGRAQRRPVAVLPGSPSADELTLRLRLAMEAVDGWPLATAPLA